MAGVDTDGSAALPCVHSKHVKGCVSCDEHAALLASRADESGFPIPGRRGGKTDWIVKAAADHVLADGMLKVAAASPERAEEVRDRVMEVVRDAVNKDWSA